MSTDVAISKADPLAKMDKLALRRHPSIDTLSVDVGTSIDFPVHNFGLKKGLWDLFFFGCLLFEHFVKGLFFLENVAGLDQILANPGSYLCVVGAVKLKGG